VAAIRVSVGLVPLVRQPLGILRGGFRCAFCSSGDWRMGGVAESLFCVSGMSRGGWLYCYSVVVIPGDTFCSRVRHAVFLEGQAASSRVTVSNNRSVMPLDVLGRTRATLKESACFTLPVRKDRVTAEPPSWLGLGTAMIPMNQESLVGAGH
jgi:hypothetical protein